MQKAGGLGVDTACHGLVVHAARAASHQGLLQSPAAPLSYLPPSAFIFASLRDVKTSNILLTAPPAPGMLGTAKLSDFGLACLAQVYVGAEKTLLGSRPPSSSIPAAGEGSHTPRAAGLAAASSSNTAAVTGAAPSGIAAISAALGCHKALAEGQAAAATAAAAAGLRSSLSLPASGSLARPDSDPAKRPGSGQARKPDQEHSMGLDPRPRPISDPRPPLINSGDRCAPPGDLLFVALQFTISVPALSPASASAFAPAGGCVAAGAHDMLVSLAHTESAACTFARTGSISCSALSWRL